MSFLEHEQPDCLWQEYDSELEGQLCLSRTGELWGQPHPGRLSSPNLAGQVLSTPAHKSCELLPQRGGVWGPERERQGPEPMRELTADTGMAHMSLDADREACLPS